ncbi:hypothetical protein EON81_06890 [bacterium]|nr:MAG: hypothetical protein EON81_06890 [bacterium]
MAELLTTKAETDSASYLDWDDAALGKLCKYTMLAITTTKPKAAVKDLDPVGVMAGASVVVWRLQGLGIDGMRLGMDGLTHGGESLGDWTVDIARKGSKSAVEVDALRADVKRLRAALERSLRLAEELSAGYDQIGGHECVEGQRELLDHLSQALSTTGERRGG